MVDVPFLLKESPFHVTPAIAFPASLATRGGHVIQSNRDRNLLEGLLGRCSSLVREKCEESCLAALADPSLPFFVGRFCVRT